MDIEPGDGMDGAQAAEQILEKHDLPLVFILSNPDTETLEKVESITSYGFVTRNGSIVEVNSSIKMALRLFEANENTRKELAKRKRAEEALRDSEKKFRNLFMHHTAVKLIIDPENGNIVEANEAAARFYGWPVKELQNMTISRIITLPQDEIKKEMERAKSLKKIHFETKHRKADGSIVDVEVFNSKIDIDGKTLLHSIIHDVTEKQESRNTLLQSEENFKRSVADSPFGIRIVTLEGKTVYANKAFLDIFQINSFEEFSDPTIKVRYTPESYAQHLERKEKRKRGQTVNEYEVSIVLKSGETRHIKIYRNEVLWNGTLHNQVINQDITEQKKLTRELITAKGKAEESDRLKSAFLATISHELRTPLTSIIGFSDVMCATTENEQDRKYASIIHENGKALLAMIEDIFDLALVEKGTVQIRREIFPLLDLQEKMTSTLEELLSEHGKSDLIQFSFRPDKDLLQKTMHADRTKIIQVLTNLFRNAVKFTKKGSIEFGFYSRQPDQITFYVKDTGIGIPEEKRDILFDFFRQGDDSDTRKYGGLGIGLAISKRIAEVLDGFLSVESEHGKGSVFYLTLPVTFTETAGAQEEKSKKSDSSRKMEKTILIVDDDEIGRTLIKTALKDTGIQFVEAQDGKEAVSQYKNNPNIDLVLMDLKMPVMDGFEATKKIKKNARTHLS